ncbi:Predicted glutathione S-transferase [Photobacterium sp. SKA34]|nr:Predicted glutathione S-transferase [Photobacterium sp. SKA34]
MYIGEVSKLTGASAKAIRLYQAPVTSETVDIDYIKAHNYGSNETINPTRIIPKGPELDFSKSHYGEKLGVEL